MPFAGLRPDVIPHNVRSGDCHIAPKTASKFVSYLRVSTARQGKSGLGLDAQREAVRQFVTSRAGRIIAPEFVEVESGKRDDRPELVKALKRCRLTSATLVAFGLRRLIDDPDIFRAA